MRCLRPKQNVSKCRRRRFDAHFKLIMALYAEKVKICDAGRKKPKGGKCARMEIIKTNCFLLTQCKRHSADSKKEAFMTHKIVIDFMCT